MIVFFSGLAMLFVAFAVHAGRLRAVVSR